MWSVAVFDPAFPGRSAIARGSPVPAVAVAVVDERAQRMEPEAR